MRYGICWTGCSCDLKKTLHASQQNREDVQRQRGEYQGRMAEEPAGDLIFLDESGVTTEMTRRYGRAEGGARVTEGIPGAWRTMTVLGAICTQGWVAVMTIESSTDGDIFLTYLDQVLCPKLKPGQTVILDNLAAHKVEGVRQRVESTGARLIYLPPYSPDFNPIERCWAQFKQVLRAARARTFSALELAVASALDTVLPAHIEGYFRAAGYNL